MFDEEKEAQSLISSDAIYKTWRAGVVGKGAYEPELREFGARKASRKNGQSAMQKLRRSRGLNSSFMPMHMAFTVNPGTGKTQVARLIGKILHQEGLLSVGDFRECSKSDLVYPASGWSTAMVNNLFESSIGGVIFIDEAYSLVSLPLKTCLGLGACGQWASPRSFPRPPALAKSSSKACVLWR